MSPAFGCYLQDGPDGRFGAHGMIVLTLGGDRISALTRFTDNGNLGRFGLPLELAVVTSAHRGRGSGSISARH